MSGARGSGLVAVFALVACQSEQPPLDGVPPPPIIWEGEHIRIGTDLDPASWCAGNFPRLDARVEALRKLFEIPSDDLVTYYMFEPPLSEAGVCRGHPACTYYEESTVATPLVPDDHELVHAAKTPGLGLPSFFEEGTATYFGSVGTYDSAGLADGTTVRERLDSNWDGGGGAEGYKRGADFTAYLVHRHGLDAFVDLLHASDRDMSRQEFESVFEPAIGVSLDAALDDYEADWEQCEWFALRSPFFECSGPATPVDAAQTVAFDLDLSCDAPDVFGPLADIDGVPRIWRELVVEVVPESSSVFNIEFDEPFGVPSTVRVDVQPCDRPCLPPPSYPSQGGYDYSPPEDPDMINPLTHSLYPGRWSVRVSTAADEPSRVRFRWN